MVVVVVVVVDVVVVLVVVVGAWVVDVLVVPASVVVVVDVVVVVVEVVDVVVVDVDVVSVPVVVVVGASVVEVVVVPASVVVVVLVVVVVDVLDTVVDGWQLPPTQASQQLGTDPTHAVPPFGARQKSALLLMLHRVRPRESVRQQATEPGLPHVELPAHSRNLARHGPRRSPLRVARFATRAMQLT